MAEQEKVTAGPWVNCGTCDEKSFVCGGTQVICKCDDANHHANARLIVAAVTPLFEINPTNPTAVAAEIGNMRDGLVYMIRVFDYLRDEFSDIGHDVLLMVPSDTEVGSVTDVREVLARILNAGGEQ